VKNLEKISLHQNYTDICMFLYIVGKYNFIDISSF